MSDTNVGTFLKSLHPKGMLNVGATCYFATSLQCLSHCESFLKLFLSIKHDPEQPLLSKLREVLITCWVKGIPANPLELLREVQRQFQDVMSIFQQNDAMEFLTLFLDKINDEIGERRAKLTMSNGLKGMNRLVNYMDVQWHNSNSLAYSKLTDMVYGQNVMQMMCTICSSIEHSSEVFVCIHVAFDESESHNLSNMVNRYYASEKIDSRECDKCKGKHMGTKSLKLWKAPTLLMVHLKRFTPSNTKINKSVSIPEHMNLESIYIFDDNVKYELKAIACHTGACQGGHYFAICRRPNGAWFIYDDDDDPKEIESYTNVSSSMFYIMFYELF